MRATFMHPTHLAGLAAHHSPAGDIAAAVVVALFVLVFAVTAVLVMTPARHDHGDERDGDSGPEGGGGGPGGSGPNHPRPPGDDPVWWPEFERQFADYVTSTIRA